MSESPGRRYALWGIYLSMLASLVAFALLVIQRAWTLSLQISLVFAVLGLVIFAILDPARVRMLVSGRQIHYRRKALMVTVVVVAILAVTNLLVYQNPLRWDLTEGKRQSLAPETIDTLDALQEPVTALAFFGPMTPKDSARELLDNYQYHSQGKFAYEFIDPEADPVRFNQANVTREATIVLQMAGRQEQITYIDERELTGALIRLINPGDRTVYFLTGHGEHDPGGGGGKAFSYVRKTLERKNYSVSTLNLLAVGVIPANASVLVIAGPSQPLSSEEVDLLAAYLADGGGLIVMAEPLPVAGSAPDGDPLAEYLDAVWGLKLGEDIIVDLSSNKPLTAVANQYGSHPITDKMRGLVTFYPDARSVTVSREVTGIGQFGLVHTASQSWAERDLEAVTDGREIVPDEGVDLLGPVTVAVAAENFESDGRLVVFGDSDFASDARFSAYGNGDIFINAVDWAAEADTLISLTPKNRTPRVIVPPRMAAYNAIVFVLVFALPGLVVILGGVVWYRKWRAV